MPSNPNPDERCDWDVQLDACRRDESGQIEQLRVIRNSGSLLLDLINDVLDFSKLEAGKVQIQMEPYSPETAAREVLKLFEPRAKEKNLELKLHAEPDNPKTVLGTSNLFRQVLSNLVSNAIKFTEKGTVEVEVKSRFLSASHIEVVCSIKDSGVGMTVEQINKLFVPFSQVDSSTTRHFGGTGLGLAISKGLCEKMGGRIWVESKLGKGSTFAFAITAEVTANSSLLSPDENPFRNSTQSWERDSHLKS